METPAIPIGMAGAGVCRNGTGLVDGFSFGWEAADRITNEFLQVAFALKKEVATHPREFMRPALRHFERELFYVFAVNEPHLYFAAHSSSPSVALNFSCDRMHSSTAMSERTPRYVG